MLCGSQMLASLPALAADALVLSAPSPPGPALTATPEPAAEGHAVWYGWQTLLVDLASVSLEFVALSANNGASIPVVVAGAVVYLAGGPVIHCEHDRSTIGALDLSFRVGLPVLLGVLGGAAGSKERPAGCDEFCLSPSTTDAVWGVLVGIGAAMMVDTVALAWEPAPEAKPRAARAAGFRWAPTAMPTRNGAVAGIGGTF